jgi:hypothetical protein
VVGSLELPKYEFGLRAVAGYIKEGQVSYSRAHDLVGQGIGRQHSWCTGQAEQWRWRHEIVSPVDMQRRRPQGMARCQTHSLPVEPSARRTSMAIPGVLLQIDQVREIDKLPCLPVPETISPTIGTDNPSRCTATGQPGNQSVRI